MMVPPQVRHWEATTAAAALGTNVVVAAAGSPAPPDAPANSAGVASLSAWNHALLIATILLFSMLSLLSGRVLWRQYAARRRLLRRPPSSEPAGATLNKHSYAVTPRTGSAHSSFSGLPSQSQLPPPSAGVSASTGLLDDESSASASTGAEMRQRFFLLLFVASTIRVFSLVTEIATLSAAQTTMGPTSFAARLLTLFLWLPSLLFVTMYGLVLLFWAQLCYACWGKAYPWPRRVFFGFNVLLYVAFGALFAFSSTAGGFWKGCDLVLGAVYFLGLFAILYYSVRLIFFFRTQSPDEDFFFDLPQTAAATSSSTSPRQAVLRRITAVCILLCVLFAAKAVYLLGMGSGVLESEEAQYRSPVGVHHIAFEFAIHFATEFVPAALLIVFTRESKGKAELERASSGSSTAASSGLPGASSNAAAPGSANGKPITPSYSFRVRNNSGNAQLGTAHQPYPDDTAPMLSGYQYQATQRAYGTASTASASSMVNLRGSNGSGAYLLEPLAGGGFPTSVGLTHANTPASGSSSTNYH